MDVQLKQFTHTWDAWRQVCTVCKKTAQEIEEQGLFCTKGKWPEDFRGFGSNKRPVKQRNAY